MRGSSVIALRQRRSFEADEIDVDALRGQRMGVVPHAGAAAQISEGDDGGSHAEIVGGGAAVFYLRIRLDPEPREQIAATRRRYSAVDRMSSIGAISVATERSCLGDRRPAGERGFGCRGSRTTVGATLPSRDARTSPCARRSTPAITTLEIACAARVPTFRNH